MAVDERSRHALYTRLQEVLGEEHATVLIEHLPPVGWADVATKHDLDQLEARLEARFEANEQRMEATEHRLTASFHAEMNRIYAEMNRQTRLMFVGMATAFAAVAGVAFGVAQLA